MEITVDKIRELWKDPAARKFLISGGILFFSLLFLSIVIIPLFVELARVSRQAKDIKRNIEVTEDRINRIDQLKARVDELTKKLGQHSKQLPAAKEITELLEGFAAIAMDSEVKIQAITPMPLKDISQDKTSGRYYQEMPIKITAKSGYHQLGHFISSLEDEKRVIVIDNLEIIGDVNNPKAHSVIMDLKTYVSIVSNKQK